MASCDPCLMPLVNRALWGAGGLKFRADGFELYVFEHLGIDGFVAHGAFLPAGAMTASITSVFRPLSGTTAVLYNYQSVGG